MYPIDDFAIYALLGYGGVTLNDLAKAFGSGEKTTRFCCVK